MTALNAVPGVTHVSAVEADGHVRCEVEGTGKQDIRAPLAAAVVGKGWSLDTGSLDPGDHAITVADQDGFASLYSP